MHTSEVFNCEENQRMHTSEVFNCENQCMHTSEVFNCWAFWVVEDESPNQERGGKRDRRRCYQKEQPKGQQPPPPPPPPPRNGHQDQGRHSKLGMPRPRRHRQEQHMRWMMRRTRRTQGHPWRQTVGKRACVSKAEVHTQDKAIFFICTERAHL